MKFTYLAYAITSSLILTACGGSGGSNQINHDQAKIQQLTFNQGSVQGGVITIDSNQNFHPGNKIETIVIGDKTYDLEMLEDDEWNDWSWIDGNYSYSGYLAKRNDEYLFYHGLPTTDMPTQGSANYQGSARLISKDMDDYVKLDSQFNIDFSNKSLNGSLNAGEYNIELAATINGNTFSGSKKGISTRGGFYGPNAAELAGSFINDEKTFAGVYSAEKE